MFGLWFVAIPEGTLVRLIEGSLGGRDLSVEVVGLKKGLFYNFTSQEVVLKRADTKLLSVEHLAARIHPLSLFLMRPSLSFRGEMGGGLIEGRIDRRKGGNQAWVRFAESKIGEAPLLATLGFSGQGMLSGELALVNGSGDLRFSIEGVQLQGRSLYGAMIPWDLFERAQGVLTIEGDRIYIRSFSLEGRGLYARVRGEIRRQALDLKVEVMPDPSLAADKSPRLSLIAPFKVSPGYYVIPIKSDLPLDP